MLLEVTGDTPVELRFDGALLGDPIIGVFVGELILDSITGDL